MDVKKRALVAASVAGLLAAGLFGLGSRVRADESEEAGDDTPCYGINKCKGVGACGGTSHSCAGQNACKGQGYLEIDKDACLKIQGGRLTPEAPPS